jgi:hypothetical protein
MLAIVGLAGCAPTAADAQREPAAEACGLGTPPEPGELRTVLEGDTLGEEASVGPGTVLADGSVVLTYDLDPDEAGDSDDFAGEVPEPGLLHLREDSCEPFPLPTVDGKSVAPDATPVAADDDGRLYLWDRAEFRLVRGNPGGTWETVAVIPSELLRFTYAPAVTISDGGEVFVATDFLVSRLTAAGELDPVAGTGEGTGQSYPPPDPGTFPRPGTSAPLTRVSGIAAAPSGALVITTGLSVLELDPSGTLRLVADPETTAGQDGAFQPRTYNQDGIEVGSTIAGVQVTGAGDVLVSDFLIGADGDRKRILGIRDGRLNVLLEHETYLSPSRGSALFPDDAAVLLMQDGGRAIAVYGLPAD